MRTSSDFMVTIFMTAIAAALAFVGYAYQRGVTPDVERYAGKMWADVSHDTFASCPRDNGIRFWMGCTDKAPMKRTPPQ
jgi:hypothetical protein